MPVGPTVEVPLEIGKGVELPARGWLLETPVPGPTGMGAVPVGLVADVPLEMGKGAVLPEVVRAGGEPVPGPVAVVAGPVPVGPIGDVRFDVGYEAELSETSERVDGLV